MANVIFKNVSWKENRFFLIRLHISKPREQDKKNDIIQNNYHLLREISQVEKELGISRGGKTKESKSSDASVIRDKKVHYHVLTICFSI